MKRTISGKGGLLMIAVMIMVIAVSLHPVAGWAGSPENSLPGDPGKFNGIWWGQYLGELKDMRFASYDSKNSGELYYVRPGDVLELGDVKLEYVLYGFWKGIYSSFVFGVKGSGDWKGLKRICFENFESWHQPDRYVERYYWVGNHSAMTLEYNEAEDVGQLYVYSKTIYERQLAKERAWAGPQLRKGFWR